MPSCPPPPRERQTSHGPCLVSRRTCRYGRSWPMLLFTGYILSSSCFLSARAINLTIPVTLEPWLPMEGEDVTIIPAGDVKGVLFCNWFRGNKPLNDTQILRYELPASKYHYGKAYTKRETIKQHCSLHITKLTLKDNGIYLVQKERAPNETSEFGEKFLLVGEDEPKAKLTGIAIAGIVVGTLLGVLGVAGLLVYQTSKTRS